MKKNLFAAHRLLGAILSLFFLMWFLSGFVLIYKGFPRVGNEAEKHVAPLPDALPAPALVQAMLPDSGAALKSFSVQTLGNHTVFDATAAKKKLRLTAVSDSLLIAGKQEKIPFAVIETYARNWNNAPVERVDTLRQLEQWIPFARYKTDFPIYKFRFADANHSILYLSSVSGKALQYCTRTDRIWAYLGPIPHWLYFASLRSNAPLWRGVLGWLAAIGSILCLTGMILGARAYWCAWRHKKKFRTPYRRFFYKWHHIAGFFFGFFVFTFVFSGMMSVVQLPQWVVKTHNSEIEAQLNAQATVRLADFRADYREIPQKYPHRVKSIGFEYFGEKPIYVAVVDDSLLHFDASSTGALQPLRLTEADVRRRLAPLIGDAPLNVAYMTEFDHYYIGRTNRMSLPVYKAVANNADGSTFYVNPETGYIRYFNRNLKVRKWMYPAFHSFRVKFLIENPFWWNVVMWTLMIGGTAVSVTGVVLATKYLVRLMTRRGGRRHKNRQNHSGV